MGPKVGSKCKGNEPICEESPLRYDHSSYPSQEAFDMYSTRTITYGRIVNFGHLDFMGFNQLMCIIRWLTFARLSNPSYPSLISRLYANMSKPYQHQLDLVSILNKVDIELDPSTMCRILGVNNDGDEVYGSNN